MHPAKLQSLLNQAVAHHQAGRLAEADRLYAQIRAASPNHFDALHLSGVVALQQNRAKTAVDLLTRALRVDPASAVCEMRLGLAHRLNGNLPEAEARLRAALKRQPAFPEAWDNLAYCLKVTNRLAEAAAAHRRAVELKPDFATAWTNLGCTCSLLGHVTDALAAHQRALALDPKNSEARLAHAQALQQAHRNADAAAEYAAALALNPHNHTARSNRLLTLNYLENLSRDAVFAEHLAYGRALAAAAPPAVPAPLVTKTQLHIPGAARPPLRLAFLSPDLRTHSVAYFLEPLLRHLDRARFEIVLYHDHFQDDAASARLRTHASLWRNFVGQPDSAVEAAIRADAPDILVDLAGHTGMNRLPLFARRLAPLQISYLGYPNTTGLREMDCRFVDPVTDPGPDDDRHHTEQLIRFAPTAWLYQPPTDAPEPHRAPSTEPLPTNCQLPTTNSQLPAPETPNPKLQTPNSASAAPRAALTFGSFNNFAKISAHTLRLWSRLLADIPGSRLLLKSLGLAEPAVAARALERLRAAGIDPARAELLDRTDSTAAHLALYSKIDVALDTFPYHGTTTTCEALWMGVPVVTLHGDRHAARVSSSLLSAAGHPEWIARDDDDYVRIAAALATDPSRIAKLRATLRDDLRRSPLLDHAAQAARFTSALLECWEARTHLHPAAPLPSFS